MKPEIKKLDELRVVGVKRTITNVSKGENFTQIPKMWQEELSSGLAEKLHPINNGELKGLLGICTTPDCENDSFEYYIGVTSDKPTQDNFVELHIEPYTYAVFSCTMDKIQETWKQIYHNWLPNNKEYEHLNATEIEHYPTHETCEIYIPVKNK